MNKLLQLGIVWLVLLALATPTFAQDKRKGPHGHGRRGGMGRPGFAPERPGMGRFERKFPPGQAEEEGKKKKRRAGGHWLRQYGHLPAGEQEKILDQDPEFQRLDPQQKERLKERLRNFNSLPPEMRQRMLDRMERLRNLTPEQRQRAEELFHRLRALPPGRQKMLRRAFRHLREMPPEERERAFKSEKFRSRFNEQESGLLRELVAIEEAAVPAETGDNPEQDF